MPLNCVFDFERQKLGVDDVNITEFDSLLAAITPAAVEEYLRGRGWRERPDLVEEEGWHYFQSPIRNGHVYTGGGFHARAVEIIARAESRSPLAVLADLVGPAAVYEAVAAAVGADPYTETLKRERNEWYSRFNVADVARINAEAREGNAEIQLRNLRQGSLAKRLRDGLCQMVTTPPPGVRQEDALRAAHDIAKAIGVEDTTTWLLGE